MVATRSACVDEPLANPYLSEIVANSVVPDRSKEPSVARVGPKSSATRSPSRPSRSNTKRSKFDALLMSMLGEEVSKVSAVPRTR